MTVSDLFKKFRCCKPAPILPTTQVQTTSYTYQIAFVQWALEYVLQVTEGYEERLGAVEHDVESLDTAIVDLNRDFNEGIANLAGAMISKTALKFNDTETGTVEDLENIIYDGKTYRAAGGGGKPEIISVIGSVADIGSVSSTNIQLYESIKTTNKLTVAGGKVVVGAGVSKIKVSGGIQIGLYSGGNDQAYIALTKGGSSVANGGAYLPTTVSGVGYVPLIERCILVGSGDQLSFSASGLGSFTAGTISAFLHFEVLE